VRCGLPVRQGCGGGDSLRWCIDVGGGARTVVVHSGEGSVVDGADDGEVPQRQGAEGSEGGRPIDDLFHGRVELTETVVVAALRTAPGERDGAPTVLQ
jgi:hypothetical protein